MSNFWTRPEGWPEVTDLCAGCEAKRLAAAERESDRWFTICLACARRIWAAEKETP